MSDALCGPSNPLQQFKQQSQLDRTLQQDRFTSRHSPAQGFRSRDPNAGLLDPEFEAFQAGVKPAPEPFHFQFQPLQQPSGRLNGPSQAPSWATDFQRMQISPPPTFQQQRHVLPPVSATTNWVQGFQTHVAQTAPRAQNSSPSPQAFQYMARHGANGYQPNFVQPSFAPSMQSKGKEAVTEQFDDAAFERAFDQAREDMMVDTEDVRAVEEIPYQTGASTGSYEEHVDQVRKEAMAAIREHQENVAKGHDNDDMTYFEDKFDFGDEPMNEVTIQQQEEKQEQTQERQQEDDDALAATAQELLEKVEHNKTDKFRNSQFFGLMRRLRDREVKVEGDKMVETVRATTLKPPPTSTPIDSTYASGTASPVYFERPTTVFPRTPPPEFDSHIEHGWGEEHEFDHWESAYR